MQVQLIDFTGAGAADPAHYAATRLAFTKNTRLEMKPGLLAEIEAWPAEKLEAELTYMANTIPSSWEFIDYTFLITDVTRAFTHQFVRTRTGSYAQQTMRVLDVGGWTYGTGPTIESDEEAKAIYDKEMTDIATSYDRLIDMGVNIEDARGILPTNIHTNIVAKFNLRTMADTARKRASGRTQGEYRAVMEAMKAEVIRVHPWADKFFNRTFDVAAAELEAKITTLCGTMKAGDIIRTGLIKLIDQMRATA
jgi:thymidylate synthase (FAD)